MAAGLSSYPPLRPRYRLDRGVPIELFALAVCRHHKQLSRATAHYEYVRWNLLGGKTQKILLNEEISQSCTDCCVDGHHSVNLPRPPSCPSSCRAIDFRSRGCWADGTPHGESDVLEGTMTVIGGFFWKKLSRKMLGAETLDATYRVASTYYGHILSTNYCPHVTRRCICSIYSTLGCLDPSPPVSLLPLGLELGLG